jgi:hypothetical protein
MGSVTRRPRAIGPAGIGARAGSPDDDFERLLGVARRIMGHVTFPRKHGAVERC